MENRKAPGIDGITAEVLKPAGKAMVSFLEKLLQRFGMMKLCLVTGQRCCWLQYTRKEIS